MTSEATRRAVAKFLAADKTDLNKLHFLSRLASLARSLGQGRALSDDDRENALRLVAHQSPHRSWNRSRFSEARLVFDCYLHYGEVVEALVASGRPFTWHDVISALRQTRRGAPVSLKKPSRREPLRTALASLAKKHGLSVANVERTAKSVHVTFMVKGKE